MAEKQLLYLSNVLGNRYVPVTDDPINYLDMYIPVTYGPIRSKICCN